MVGCQENISGRWRAWDKVVTHRWGNFLSLRQQASETTYSLFKHFSCFLTFLVKPFFGLRVLYFFCLFIGRECFAVSSIISVNVLFAFSTPSELFVNDVAKKFWTWAFISLLPNAAL